MASTLRRAILAAIASEGSVASIEALGYTTAQVAVAMRRMVEQGDLVRRDGKFYIGPHVRVDKLAKGVVEPLRRLDEYAVEKISENEQYTIGHQTFAQIRERVRP